MPKYRFEASTATGALQTGIREAADPSSMRAGLRQEGLLPISIEPIIEQVGQPEQRLARIRLKTSELAVLTRQWASLLGSGLPLDSVLESLAEVEERPLVRSMLLAVREQVLAGRTLTSALSAFPRTFDTLYRALVAAGTESGHLPVVLERHATYLEHKSAWQQQLGLALLYPMLVAAVALTVIMVMMTYIMPQVVTVFQHSHQSLPWLTRFFMAVSHALQVGWSYGLIGVLILIWLARKGLASERGRNYWHRLALRLPGLGVLWRSLEVARFANTLAILVKSGLPLVQALTVATEVMQNVVLRRAVGEITAKVIAGVPLSRALAAQQVFPKLLARMVASGEQSGEIGTMLEKAAQQQEQNLERLMKWAMGLLEPFFVVLLGGVVLLLVLAVMLPMVSINQLIR